MAIPLVGRGVAVSGIELSQPMADRLLAKSPGFDVTVGDMATTTVPGEFSLVYVVWNSIGNVRTQAEQVATFRNAARHLVPGGRFVVELGCPASGASHPARRRCRSTSGAATSASTPTT